MDLLKNISHFNETKDNDEIDIKIFDEKSDFIPEPVLPLATIIVITISIYLLFVFISIISKTSLFIISVCIYLAYIT